MLIVTAKLPRRKLAFGAAAAALLCCAALVLNLVPCRLPGGGGPRRYSQLQGDPNQRGPGRLSQRLRLAGHRGAAGCGGDPHPGGDG